MALLALLRHDPQNTFVALFIYDETLNKAQIHPLNKPEDEWKYEKVEYRKWIEDVIRKTFPEYAERQRTKSNSLKE